MGSQVGPLLQQVQAQIIQQALQQGCNAVLALTFNVTNDSSGERGHFKMCVVTALGTPCCVVPTTRPPTVQGQPGPINQLAMAVPM